MGNLVQPPAGSTFANLNATYPGYLVDAHAQLLSGSVAGVAGNAALTISDAGSSPYNAIAFTEQAVDDNPYVNAEALDPEDALTIARSPIDELEELIDTYITSAPNTTGEQQALEDFVTKAAALYEAHANTATDAAIEAEVTAFEQESEEEYLRRRNQFEGQSFMINAVDSSTPYLIGLAIISGERSRALDNLRARLRAQGSRDKNVFISQLTQMMLSAQTRNAGLLQTVAAMRGEYARFDYTAHREEMMQNIEYDVGEVEWELEVLKSGISAIGAMQGIPVIQKKPSNLATAVSSALSIGPQVGLSVGNAFGNPVLGLLAGGFAALSAYNANING